MSMLRSLIKPEHETLARHRTQAIDSSALQKNIHQTYK